MQTDAMTSVPYQHPPSPPADSCGAFTGTTGHGLSQPESGAGSSHCETDFGGRASARPYDIHRGGSRCVWACSPEVGWPGYG